MLASNDPATNKAGTPSDGARITLNLAAIDAARRSPEQAAVTPQLAPWRKDILQLLNDALATELVCVLRYRRHHFTAAGLASPRIAEEFLVHANQELAHADRLAKRIVQLGGEPDFAPESLHQRAHASYDSSPQLKAMIRADLVAERVAIETYGQLAVLIGEKDPTTRRLFEDLLAEEQAHAEELATWLAE